MSGFKFNGKGINELFTGVSASHTGSSSETILSSIQIPANRYTQGDFIMIDSMLFKTGSGIGTVTIKFYWVAGTTATLTNAIQLSIRTIASGSVFVIFSRRIFIWDPSGAGSNFPVIGSEIASTSTGLFSDYGGATTVTSVSNLPIDWTVDGTIFATIAQNAANSITQYYIKIWEFPYPVGRISG